MSKKIPVLPWEKNEYDCHIRRYLHGGDGWVFPVIVSQEDNGKYHWEVFRYEDNINTIHGTCSSLATAKKHADRWLVLSGHVLVSKKLRNLL